MRRAGFVSVLPMPSLHLTETALEARDGERLDRRLPYAQTAMVWLRRGLGMPGAARHSCVITPRDGRGPALLVSEAMFRAGGAVPAAQARAGYRGFIRALHARLAECGATVECRAGASARAHRWMGAVAVALMGLGGGLTALLVRLQWVHEPAVEIPLAGWIHTLLVFGYGALLWRIRRGRAPFHYLPGALPDGYLPRCEEDFRKAEEKADPLPVAGAGKAVDSRIASS